MRRPKWLGGEGKVQAEKPAPSSQQVKVHWTRQMMFNLRYNRRLHLLLVALIAAAAGALYPTYLIADHDAQNAAIVATQDEKIATLEDTVTQVIDGCIVEGTCQVYDYETAQKLAILYASACFNYSQDHPSGQQAERLTDAGGPEDCGWVGAGTGSALVFADPDPSRRLAVLGSDGKPRPDLGIVGVRVQMAGQTQALRYSVPVKFTDGVPSIESAGALFTTPPNTSVEECLGNTNDAGTELKARIQSMRAGQVGTPNINPDDYLPTGMHMANFGPSITQITVQDITVCRGSDPNKVRAITHEVFDGPNPGSQFRFAMGYTAERESADAKWVITGWGPITQGISLG